MTTSAALTSAANTSSTNTSTTQSATSTKSLAQNFNTFLNMLTTQLKHQDPLSPMDSTQFTNQLVQFASVEQQINTNSNLEKLITSTNLNTKSQAISYIGHSIEADSSNVPLQDGKANFAATLAGDTASASVVVKDSSGTIVANLPLQKSTSRQEMTWDGKDKNGNQLPDGLYSLSISALDGNGASVDGAISVYGKVTDVASDENGTLIGMGKVVVGIDKVLTVRDTASMQSSSSSAASQ
jgi:flagellar basal-body rod modification protein FlgD